MGGQGAPGAFAVAKSMVGVALRCDARLISIQTLSPHDVFLWIVYQDIGISLPVAAGPGTCPDQISFSSAEHEQPRQDQDHWPSCSTTAAGRRPLFRIHRLLLIDAAIPRRLYGAGSMVFVFLRRPASCTLAELSRWLSSSTLLSIQSRMSFGLARFSRNDSCAQTRSPLPGDNRL